jgi:hypothetical protein
MILFWFEILSWNIRYLSAKMLLRTRMRMLKHNFVVKFGNFKLRIFLKVKKRLISHKLENYVSYGMGLHVFRL